uniref:Uncharacterized protein n=1 Tax=Glossina pallidipes TaxID=7398 RepID=A0A1A9Z8R9_GLOPL
MDDRQLDLLYHWQQRRMHCKIQSRDSTNSSLHHLITVERTLLRISGCILYKPQTPNSEDGVYGQRRRLGAMQSIKFCGYNKPKHDAEHRNEITMHSISNVRYMSHVND